jgi:hypothetical protein
MPKTVDLDLVRPVPLCDDLLWKEIIAVEASENFGREAREVGHGRSVPPPD